MRSALSQGKRSCRRSALCCLCLLSHFLLFFITFNTYSRYEPGEATQWRYADVWAFRSGTYWNLKHGRRTPAGSADCVWDDGHGAMRSPGSGPAEPMLLRWWRWWCFRSCWCQNAPLLSSVLHILHTSESVAAVLYLVESKWQFVTQKDESRNERSRPLFFFPVNATCDIIFKCHCELSQDFKLLRFCLRSIFVECSQVRKMKASNIGRG